MSAQLLQFCSMKNTRYAWREAFTFSRTEIRGLRVLTFLLGLVILVRLLYFRYHKPEHIVFAIPPSWEEIDTLETNEETRGVRRNDNQPGASTWKRRTWSERSSRQDSPLQHTYGEPFRRSRVIELNGADTLELRSLPSIGPWLARKIVAYRERLGGFLSPEQLLEVYRLTPGKLDTIMPFIVLDTSAIRRIDINQINAEELMKHPYISRSQARGLIAYRDKHGDFRTVEELSKCLLMDEKTLEKLRDYVEVR